MPLVIFLFSIYPTILSLPTDSFTSYDQDLLTYRILFRFAGTAGSVYAIEESRLIDSIGMAQMEQEIENKVINLVKQNSDKMAEDTGVVPSLEEEVLKNYYDLDFSSLICEHFP
jgi:hypothetical protein